MAASSLDSTTTIADRSSGLVLGGLIADAGGQPIHWIYDVAKLHASLSDAGRLEQPEFLPHSINPFYRIATGRNTVYGDQIFVLLRSLASQRGQYDSEHYAKETFAFFGNEGDGAYGPFPAEPVPRDQLPQHKPWRTATLRHFLTTITDAQAAGQAAPWTQAGLVDEQADSFAKVGPLVAAFVSRHHQHSSAADVDLAPLLAQVEAAASITQTGPIATASALAAARILFQVALGSTVRAAVVSVASQLASDTSREVNAALAAGLTDAVARAHTIEHAAFAKELGLSCSVPASFFVAVHAVLSATDETETPSTEWYLRAVRQTFLAGGDSASRSCLIGSLIGAAIGAARLPQEWLAQALAVPQARTYLASILV